MFNDKNGPPSSVMQNHEATSDGHGNTLNDIIFYLWLCLRNSICFEV